MSDNHWGFNSENPRVNRSTTSKKPLYFLIGSAILLFAVLIFLFLTQVIGMGRDIAESPGNTTSETADDAGRTSDPAAPTDGEPDTDAEPDTGAELAAAAADVTALPSSTTCDDPAGDAATIGNYVNAAVTADAWDSVAENTVLNSLTGIDRECPKDYTLGLQDELTGDTAATQLTTLIQDASWIEEERPAPEGAIEATSFTTPANNIRCAITDSAVECSIFTYSYPSPDGCEGFTATYNVGKTGEVSAGCDAAVESAEIYEYGTNVAANGFACTLDRYSVTCWSELSGHGYELKRAADRIF